MESIQIQSQAGHPSPSATQESQEETQRLLPKATTGATLFQSLQEYRVSRAAEVRAQILEQISNTSDINYQGEHGQTILCLAVNLQDEEFIKACMERRANPNKANQFGKNAIQQAAALADTTILTSVLSGSHKSQKPKLKATDKHHLTPLHQAVLSKNLRAMEILLEHGAEPAPKIKGCSVSAMHMAATSYPEGFEFMLGKVGWLKTKNAHGMTMLHGACVAAQSGIVESILKAPNISLSKELNRQDSFGRSPAHLAVMSNSTDMLNKLADHEETRFDLTDKSGQTPLHRAVDQETVNPDMVTRLLEKEAGIHKRDKSGQSALHKAAAKGHANIVTMLLNKGLSPEQEDKQGYSALHLAIMAGHKDVVTLFANAEGFDANKPDSKGKLPLHHAIHPMKDMQEERYMGTIRVLLNKGADPDAPNADGKTPLVRTCRLGQQQAVTLLLNHKADRQKLDDNGHTPLMHACEKQNIECIKALYSRSTYAEVMNQPNKSGFRPLVAACLSSKKPLDVVDTLLRNYANPNESNIIKSEIKRSKDLTPLAAACISVKLQQREETVDKLLYNNADPNKPVESFQGMTPLHLAAKNGQTEIVRKMLSYGGDKNKTDNKGFTPGQLAIIRGHYQTAELLK
ncbi:ankyrin-2 [Elysia marginata]|uniref:Ankyrin-2 n=1 Tax=Elysia marginata TaxID=1093978 RepID=A0AAV4IUV5_9GAST|nr:ankyrin-2 [Elysia marginata]